MRILQVRLGNTAIEVKRPSQCISDSAAAMCVRTTGYRRCTERDKSDWERERVLVEAEFEVLSEEISRHKSVLPDGDDAAVVDGKAQLRQCHVQLVHPADRHAGAFIPLISPHLTTAHVTLFYLNWECCDCLQP